MKKIINEIITSIYCKYIHITKKVNKKDFYCHCCKCKYFHICDKSYFTYIYDYFSEMCDICYHKNE